MEQLQVLGDWLGVAPDDLAILVSDMVDVHDDELPPLILAELTDIVDGPEKARSRPDLWGQTGEAIPATIVHGITGI